MMHSCKNHALTIPCFDFNLMDISIFFLFRYLKTHLSVAHPDQAELESMRTELQFAKHQIDSLK